MQIKLELKSLPIGILNNAEDKIFDQTSGRFLELVDDMSEEVWLDCHMVGEMTIIHQDGKCSSN